MRGALVSRDKLLTRDDDDRPRCRGAWRQVAVARRSADRLPSRGVCDGDGGGGAAMVFTGGRQTTTDQQQTTLRPERSLALLVCL